MTRILSISVTTIAIFTAASTVVFIACSASAADVEGGRKKAEACGACHGADGNATMPVVPSLAGQPPFYTHWQLALFRDGRRKDPQMAALAANLSDAEMADLAVYYAGQRPTARPAVAGDAEAMATGQRLAQLHHCASCHAQNLPEPRYTPHLAGQSYEYLAKQLREFKARTRGELDGATMTSVVQPLTEQEVEILARYFASLPPATEKGRP
jgi:cytochrome c553